MNKLFYGDCLQIIKDYLPPDSVDLIYLDPPFNSNRNYNAIYKDQTGQPLPEQIEAFCDIWELNAEREIAIRDLPLLMSGAGVDDASVQLWKLMMEALRKTQPRLLAYLSYMAERLIAMQTILKDSGSLYLHCDPTASHYLKVLLDALFGHNSFQNELIWLYKGREMAKTRYNPKHDVILYYSKGRNPVFNWEDIAEPKSESSLKALRHAQDEDGRWYALRYKEGGGFAPISKDGDESTYRQYESELVPPRDWVEIDYERKKKRSGYPTQKPLALLKRIILASSNKGDVVLDPFCGCATTIAAAHELKRKWIGIDIAYHAVKRVVQARLADNYRLVEDKHYQVDGIPLTREAALALWEKDKYQFQCWAVESVDGFVSSKRSNDGGIDGRLYFYEANKGALQSMIIEVKGGENIGISVVRDLRGAMERSGAKMAGLIIRTPLKPQQKRNFDNEMLAAGFLDDGVTPCMQYLTLDDILEGKKFNVPNVQVQATGQENLGLV